MKKETITVFPLEDTRLTSFQQRLTAFGYDFDFLKTAKEVKKFSKTNLPKVVIIELSSTEEDKKISEIVTEIRKLSQVLKIVGVFWGRLNYQPENIIKKGLDSVYQIPFEEELLINSIFEVAPVEISNEKLTMDALSRISIIELEWTEALPFDIFIVLPSNKKIIHYRQKGKSLEEKVLEKFKHHNRFALYIKKSDLSSYYNYSAQVLARLQKDERLSKIEKEKKMASEIKKLVSGFFAQESVNEAEGQTMLENVRKVLGNLEDSSGSKKQFANVVRELASQNMTSYSHCRNVATYCALFGLAMGFHEPETLQMGGFLHDLGMSDMPRDLLGKDFNDMTDEEKAQYKLHPGNAAMTVKFKKMKLPETVMKMILQHHEKPDGTGFPYGLKGDEIHPFARICALADEFDELTSMRFGKETLTPTKAMRKISGLDGQDASNYYDEKFFGKLVKNFLEDLGENLTQREIELLEGTDEPPVTQPAPTVVPESVPAQPPAPAPAAASESTQPPPPEEPVTPTTSRPKELEVREGFNLAGRVKVVKEDKETNADEPQKVAASTTPVFLADPKPLFEAIKSAKLDEIQKLLKQGLDVNVKDESGNTPLMYALQSGNRDIAKAVLRAKADLNVQDAQGNTPIMQAISANNYEMFNLVLVTAFENSFVGAKQADPAAGKVWASSALNINIKNKDGDTALMLTVRKGSDQMLEALLDAGADMFVKNPKGETVKNIAQSLNKPSMVQTLGKFEEINKKNDEFFAEAAPEAKSKPIPGIDVKVRDGSGQTPLMQSCSVGNEEMVMKLIEMDSEIDAKDFAGQTPLMLASRRGSSKIIRALVEKSANVNAKDSQGRNPLLHAVEGGASDVIRLLVEAGCRLDIRHLGATPLMIACFIGNLNVVKALVECGANVEDKDAKGKTALDFARSKNFTQIVDYLSSLEKKKSA